MNYSLPVLNEDKSKLSASVSGRNPCGECRACCIVLPIAEPELVKPGGEPCKHLCGSGCELFGGPEWPQLCKEYFCCWRSSDWLNDRPNYRPDKLGVILQFGGSVLTLYEVRPGALQSQQVAYIKSRLKKLRGPGVIAKNYPVGVFDGIHFNPEEVKNGKTKLNPELHEWIDNGGGEITIRRKT